jgi:hypothetical protein
MTADRKRKNKHSAVASSRQKINLAREAKIIRGLLDRGKLLAKQTIDVAVEVGQRFTKVKNSPDIPHGKWLSWLQKNFAMSEATAQRYMRLHGFLAASKTRTLRDFDLSLSVLHLLAGKNTPSAVIDEVIARAQAGETITLDAVRFLRVRVTYSKPEVRNVPYYRTDPAPTHPNSVYKPAREPTVINPSDASSESTHDDEPEQTDNVLRLVDSSPRPEAIPPEVVFFKALAAIDLPLPDAHQLAAAFSRQSVLTVPRLLKIADALRELIALLLPDMPPPGGWQH